MKVPWTALGSAAMTATLHPATLRPGDTVALVSPSGPVPAERVERRGVECSPAGAWRPGVYPHVLARHGYFGGTDDQRLGRPQRRARRP